MKPRLFHLSETADIKIFRPRMSPTHFDGINDKVVFAIAEHLRHNYLMPRDCPRVTFYSGRRSSDEDRKEFIPPEVEFVIAVENEWAQRIRETTLYQYELNNEHFQLIDETARYYVSYRPEIPIGVQTISSPMDELLRDPKIHLQFLGDLKPLADRIKRSTLNYSLIRMRNAK